LTFSVEKKNQISIIKGKAIPVQPWTGPEVSRRLRLPDFKTVGPWRWLGCLPYSPAASIPRKYSWKFQSFTTYILNQKQWLHISVWLT